MRIGMTKWPAVGMVTAGLLIGTSASLAAPIDVGDGEHASRLVFNWADQGDLEHAVTYDVSYDGKVSGYDLTRIAAEGDPDLTTAWSNFGDGNNPNYFLDKATYAGEQADYVGDGATYDADTAPRNYWHQYVDDDLAGPWNPGGGASATTLDGGDRQGWVFGTSAEPVPEPASMALLGLGGLLMLRRRRA